jgi:hypothetical protein
MRRQVAALLLAGTLLAGPALSAAPEDFGPELQRLIERAERTDAADPAFLADLRDLTGTSYSSYGQEPDIDALERLIDRAERTNAADESFLADLRDLAENYGETRTGYNGSTYSDDDEDDAGSRQRVLIEDDFADGDYTQDPRWMVSAGTFSVETNGLRSQVRHQYASSDNPGEAIAGALLGALTGAGSPRAYAAIHNGTDIPNAFTVDLQVSARGDGRFDFGPYQGNGTAGYRLAFTPGAAPMVQLLKATSKGLAVIESWQGDLGPEVEFRWTRDARGAMAVSANGDTLFEVTDRSFREPFQGFVMLNGGGDFTVERVAVSG